MATLSRTSSLHWPQRYRRTFRNLIWGQTGRTFVGFGFGSIQTGLLLLEALDSGNFERLVVAEVQPDIVSAVNCNQGRARVNVAFPHGIAVHELHGIEIYNLQEAADSQRLVDAVAHADEIATALPSITFYCCGTPSPAEILAHGFERKLAESQLPQAVVYAAENHNHAAEVLKENVVMAMEASDGARLQHRVQFLNTVIGKMCGVVSDAAQITRDGLAPFVPGADRAFLVEQFNRTLISRIRLPNFERGIDLFEEKLDLLPFEEAKLYGHNAAHALLGFLAWCQGLTYVSESGAVLREFVERAFLDESGSALCQRHAGVDSLFTTSGWTLYVQDLLQRMVNPYLRDRVDRVIRDPRRKLGWNDRLIGTMRLAMSQGIEPLRYAFGAAIAAEYLFKKSSRVSTSSLLPVLWKGERVAVDVRDRIVNYIRHASDYDEAVFLLGRTSCLKLQTADQL